jgi:hypothetical protein
LRRDIEAGRVVLGGCLLTDRSSTWRCLECGCQGGRLDLSSLPRPSPRPSFWVLPLLVLLGCGTVGSLLLLGLAYLTTIGPGWFLAFWMFVCAIPVAIAGWVGRRKQPTSPADP